MIKKSAFFSFFFLGILSCFAQQQADKIEIPTISNPNFKIGDGPKLYVDHIHNNFHKISGRFKPFADLMSNDGYQIDSLSNINQLKLVDILVISNPIHQKNLGNWQKPIHNAFLEDEISVIKKWVKKGGKLLLIADHMPFAGAANNLANAFGFDFCDGFAYQLKERRNSPDVFSIDNDRLEFTEITDGNLSKKIDAITSFTGSSFTIPKNAKGILKFKKGDYCLAPEIAWRFNDNTPSTDLENNYQGAIMQFGKGKIAVFGEAAMFTAQTVTNNSGTFKFGFHSKNAPNNIQFIRNLMFWLSEK